MKTNLFAKVAQGLLGGRDKGAGAETKSSSPQEPEQEKSGVPAQTDIDGIEALLKPVADNRPKDETIMPAPAVDLSQVSLNQDETNPTASPEPARSEKKTGDDLINDLFQHEEEEDKGRSTLIASLPEVTMPEIVQTSEAVLAIIRKRQNANASKRVPRNSR